jgi:type I restriction enzyme, R subunit
LDISNEKSKGEPYLRGDGNLGDVSGVDRVARVHTHRSVGVWLTGFDVPSCSTIYLDKPMKNHTLMQTIARANRVWREKQNGLIVDYVGIFGDLQKALAIYGTTQTGDEMPIKDKEELVRLLNTTIQKAVVFSRQYGVELDTILKATGFEREKLKEDAVAAFVEKDDTRRQFFSLVGEVQKVFKSLLPDPAANQFGPIRKMLIVIAEKIRSEVGSADITSILEEVEDLLDSSIATEGYLRPAAGYVVPARVRSSVERFQC